MILQTYFVLSKIQSIQRAFIFPRPFFMDTNLRCFAFAVDIQRPVKVHDMAVRRVGGAAM